MKKTEKNWWEVLIFVLIFFVSYWFGPGDREEYSLGPMLARLVNLGVAVVLSLVLTQLVKNIARLIVNKLSGIGEEVPWEG
jgi:hypothetical protein